MFRAVFPPIIRSSKNVHTASGMCQACWLLPLAVAASKPGTYPMLCVQFLSSWWAEKPPETCTALTMIKNIVYRCSWLVMLKRIDLIYYWGKNSWQYSELFHISLDDRRLTATCQTARGQQELAELTVSQFPFPIPKHSLYPLDTGVEVTLQTATYYWQAASKCKVVMLPETIP